MDDDGGGSKGGGRKETTLRHQALQTRGIIFYSDAAHVFAFFFPWGTYSLLSLTSTTTYQRSPLHTLPAAARVYNNMCSERVYSIHGIRSCRYRILLYRSVIHTYIRVYIIVCTRIIRSPLKRFLDCFFAEHKFRPKTKRQTAHTDARKTNKKI